VYYTAVYFLWGYDINKFDGELTMIGFVAIAK